MAKKQPFDKENTTKISFSELVELIGSSCDYRFCIVDDNIDDELIELAAKHNIDLKGYKHVIETSGVQHSEKRHGNQSEDRTPLSLQDYLLIPYIIRNRDEVSFPQSRTSSREKNVILYKKKIGYQYAYVEEIRDGKKRASLLNHSARGKQKAPPMRGAKLCYHGGNMPKPAPYVLIMHWFFIPLPRPTACKSTTKSETLP